MRFILLLLLLVPFSSQALLLSHGIMKRYGIHAIQYTGFVGCRPESFEFLEYDLGYDHQKAVYALPVKNEVHFNDLTLKGPYFEVLAFKRITPCLRLFVSAGASGYHVAKTTHRFESETHVYSAEKRKAHAAVPRYGVGIDVQVVDHFSFRFVTKVEHTKKLFSKGGLNARHNDLSHGIHFVYKY